MSSSLVEAVSNSDTASSIATDLAGVVDAEVADKGVIFKTALGAAKKVKPQLVESATSRLLPEFATALDPLWASKPEGGSFGQHLAANSDQAADALLSVTDGHVEAAPGALQKVYSGLRGKAKENVVAALPRVGDVFDKNVK